MVLPTLWFFFLRLIFPLFDLFDQYDEWDNDRFIIYVITQTGAIILTATFMMFISPKKLKVVQSLFAAFLTALGLIIVLQRGKEYAFLDILKTPGFFNLYIQINIIYLMLAYLSEFTYYEVMKVLKDKFHIEDKFGMII